MKIKLLSFFIWLAVIVVVSWYFIHKYQEHVKEQVEQHAFEIQLQKRDASVAALALRCNADTNWAASLPDRGSGRVFTIDLTKSLVRTNGQSVLMKAYLEDVSERDGTCTACFDAFGTAGFDLRLNLRCTTQQAEYLLASKPEIGDSMFAIVPKIESIFRPAFEVEQAEGDADTYQIDFSDMPDVFYAEGTCVDLLLLSEPNQP